MLKKIIGCFIVAVTGFLTGHFFSRRKERKLKRQLEENKQQVKEQLAEIDSINEQMKQLKNTEKEVEKYSQLSEELKAIPEDDYEKINAVLNEFMKENNISCPYGDWDKFDEFMSNPNNKLKF